MSSQKESGSSKEPQIMEDSKRSSKSEKRGAWGNRFQFLLTSISLAVGLGNIWRFPVLAYDNGGSAFLIPYVVCALVFGLPALYLEFVVGQFTQTGPAKCFKHFMPALQGIGWTMILVAATIGIYYTVIIAWAGVYLTYAWRDTDKWSNCNNTWNSLHCSSQVQDGECMDARVAPDLEEIVRYFNGSCTLASDIPFKFNMSESLSGTEEYFENFILKKTSSGLFDFSEINIGVAASLLVMWILIALILSKGVKLIGYSSYVTATLPYMIICALFFRAVTLDGALDGIRWYLFNPKFEYIFNIKTWTEALKQICFSLSIGWGGLLTMASYSPRSHNCFTDAVIVVFADSFMSVFGGCAVFGILGFLAKESGKEIKDVVRDGTALAFVAYPEAMARMPAFRVVWSYLFFCMIFILGLSTQITIAECICSGIYDIFPKTRTKKYFVVATVAALNFCAGLLLCFGSGIYWFTIFNEFTGSISLCIAIFLEVIAIIYCYGVERLKLDIRRMMGYYNCWFTNIMGSSGHYVTACWMVTVPLLSIAVCASCLKGFIQDPLVYGKKPHHYPIPTIGLVFGWCLALLPIVAIPVFAVANLLSWRKDGKPLMDLFRIQPTLPSFERLNEETEENTPTESSIGETAASEKV